MQGVSDAVARCQGDTAACADPRRNPALARAAHAARAAGADDAHLAEAVAAGRAGGPHSIAHPEDRPAPPPIVALAARTMVEAGDENALHAAHAGWRTGGLILAFDPGDAEALRLAHATPCAALRVQAFETEDGFDFDAFAHTVRLMVLALEIERGVASGEARVRLTLAGVGAGWAFEASATARAT